LVFVAFKILDALDAGQLILHRLGDFGRLDEDRQDGLVILAGKGEFADNVLGLGGVGGDGEDEYLAVVDGADDFLTPHGGTLDADLVNPHGDANLTEVRHQVLNALPVGRAVADKYFLCHGLLKNQLTSRFGAETILRKAQLPCTVFRILQDYIFLLTMGVDASP